MRIFLHTRSKGKLDWFNKFYDFVQIPVTGDYITTELDSPWYLVQHVLHTPFSDECVAEVYAVEVDHHEVLREKVT